MIKFSELEEKLSKNDGGMLRDQLLNQIESLERKLVSQSRIPMKPDDFRAVTALVAATRMASDTLANWQIGFRS